MINLKNKYAGERLLTPWMVFIWVLIIVFIIIAVSMFYSAQADTRLVEADVLGFRILNCLSQDYYFEKSAEEINIYEKCAIKKEVIENGDYFIKVWREDEVIVNLGNGDFGPLCESQLNKGEVQENFPQCIIKNMAVYTGNEGAETLRIIVGVNQK